MSEVAFQGKKLFYQTEGRGAPVMLLHGFAENHHVWDGIATPLKNRCRLILPDIPGSGLSEILPGNASMETYAKAILAIMDKEVPDSNEPFTLIGHSMGGYIALAFAEKFPDRIKGLGLFHSSAYGDDAAKKLAREKGIEFIGKNGAEPFVKASIPKLFADQTLLERPHLVDEALELTRDISAAALIQYYQAMASRPDRTEVLRTFAGPVLFVIGKFDKSVPLEQSLQQSHIPGISHIRILDRSGHMGMREQPHESVECLLEFLEQF